MLMVEHHIDVVTGLAQRIAVMHHGALLAVRHAGRRDGERDRAVRLPRRGAVSAVASKTLLAVRDLHVYLGQSHVLQGVSFDVPRGRRHRAPRPQRRRQDDDAARDPRPRRPPRLGRARRATS